MSRSRFIARAMRNTASSQAARRRIQRQNYLSALQRGEKQCDTPETMSQESPPCTNQTLSPSVEETIQKIIQP